MKVEVEYGPQSKVALVWGPPKSEGAPPQVWRVQPASSTSDERAPQMWNLRAVDSRYEFVKEFEDEYPFPRVREELERRIAKK